MELDLRRALAAKQLQLVYQPQFDFATDGIIGVEALIRWHHPVRGVVPPAEFIPLAEEIGVINAIGDWVLRTACKQAAAWRVPVSVNLSPLQFRGGKLLETVLSVLAQSQLPASRLELEITESSLLDDIHGVVHTLNRLRRIGIAISLDDFGTGYSSLRYLQKFSFDKIKIDRSFVRDIDVHSDRQAIMRAVNSIAATLGMKTIAEGVETEAELACIRAQGCDGVQGYLTGEPTHAEAMTELLDMQQPTALAGETRDA